MGVSGYTLPLSHHEKNQEFYHTGSVAAPVNKDSAFRRTPARRCQACYWCIIEDSWKRQNHHWQTEHKDTKSCGKLQELTHKMDRYRWNILGLCEVRWKNFNETTTEEGHFFSGKEDKHERGVGFLVHKDIVKIVLGCRPVSNRLTTIRLRAVPFYITVVQAYAPESDYNDNTIEKLYDKLQNVNDQTPKDILLVHGDWNAKVGTDAYENWQGICGPLCNDDTNERGLRLLEFATFHDLLLANTFDHHKAPRRWTWHNLNGQRHKKINCILVRKRFRSGVNIARTQRFPGVDIGSDHDAYVDLPPSSEENQQAKTHKTQI